jgi:hypothetical protein
MHKPAIPSVPKPGDNRSRFDSAVKECLEILLSRRADRITPLEPNTIAPLTTDDVISNKVNELLARLQD